MVRQYLNLSQVLKQLLFENDMRQADLSRELGIPLPTIHRIVTGKSTRPNLKFLTAIAKYFHMSVEQLIDKVIASGTNSQLKSLPLDENAKMVPLITWQSIESDSRNEIAQSELMVVDVSANTFAIIMPDHSMEPLFQQGSTLIFDPDVPATDHSYVLVKLSISNNYVFRQLLIDADQKFIRALNPNLSSSSLRILSSNDKIIAKLVEVRNKL